MKINPSTIIDAQVETLKKAGVSPAKADVSDSSKGAVSSSVAGPGRSAGPAASVQIDSAAKKASTQAINNASETSDTALLDQLRARIEAGEFEINFDRVAESILGNAIAASKSKILNP